MRFWYFWEWRVIILGTEDLTCFPCKNLSFGKRKENPHTLLIWSEQQSLFLSPEICSHTMFLWAHGWQKWNLSCQRSNALINLLKIFLTAAMSSSRCAVFKCGDAANDAANMSWCKLLNIKKKPQKFSDHQRVILQCGNSSKTLNAQ